MFDELFAKFQNTLKQTKQTNASLKKQLMQSYSQLGLSRDNFHDPPKLLGKAVSFPKSQRFKQLEKEQPATSDCYLDVSIENIQKIKKGPIFTKSQRFVAQKDDQLTVINPNYDAVKKNNKQAPKIVPVSQKQLGKSRLSQATAASQTQVGPGKYFVNEAQIQNKKNVLAFAKSKRFSKQKQKYQDNPLFINQNQTKKRPPSMAVLKKKIQKNKNQITIKQQQDLRQRLKLVYWKSIPLQLDRILKSHSGAPILKQKYFDLKKMTSKQRKCALMMMLGRLDYQRGGFTNNIAKDMKNAACQVVYRRSTPKPFKFSQMEPGPDYYYPLDDLVKPNLVGFTFAKHQQKPAQKDNRDYEINDEYFKLGGDIIIMPQHKPHTLTQQQVRSLNRGPGFYDCLFSQVQKRDDVGVVKFQPITQSNARQNNCVQIKQVNDGVYFPSYDAIDPKVPGPVYSKPADVKPMHTPDKQLFPQHWLFYDGDLNKVRAQIAKNVLIGNGLDFQQYQKFTKKFKAFKNYMQLRRQQAQLLDYNPKFEVVDPHVQGFDMAKKPQKTLIQPIIKPQFDADGDNLLLQPEKQKKKLPDINFKKMVGRQQNQIHEDDQIQGDVLVIQPKKPQKHIGQIDFKKMVARPEIENQKNQLEEPNQGDVVFINPVVPAKKIANIDFKKQSSRPGGIYDQDDKQQRQQLIIQPEKPKQIKGFVQMKRMYSRPNVKIRKIGKQKASVIGSRKQISQKNNEQKYQQPQEQQQDQ